MPSPKTKQQERPQQQPKTFKEEDLATMAGSTSPPTLSGIVDGDNNNEKKSRGLEDEDTEIVTVVGSTSTMTAARTTTPPPPPSSSLTTMTSILSSRLFWSTVFVMITIAINVGWVTTQKNLHDNMTLKWLALFGVNMFMEPVAEVVLDSVRIYTTNWYMKRNSSSNIKTLAMMDPRVIQQHEDRVQFHQQRSSEDHPMLVATFPWLGNSSNFHYQTVSAFRNLIWSIISFVLYYINDDLFSQWWQVILWGYYTVDITVTLTRWYPIIPKPFVNFMLYHHCMAGTFVILLNIFTTDYHPTVLRCLAFLLLSNATWSLIVLWRSLLGIQNPVLLFVVCMVVQRGLRWGPVIAAFLSERAEDYILYLFHRPYNHWFAMAAIVGIELMDFPMQLSKLSRLLEDERGRQEPAFSQPQEQRTPENALLEREGVTAREGTTTNV